MFLTRDEARELDRRAMEEFGVPGVVLMENAGRGMAELLVSLGVGGPVVVCCGRGNNGGDGFVIARHLDNAAVKVRVLLLGDPDRLPADAAVNYRILMHSGVPLDVYGEAGTDESRLRAELDAAD
ncbi:MAG TPA: NAD(P)H-hydrate epimerase, partial [Gemmataceae bacterium]|nr:NAD(P)H-hydrate epimerase [Gemmataceae bacterium]